MLLQLLLATIAGAGFYFRSFFYRLFGGKKAAAADPIDEERWVTVRGSFDAAGDSSAVTIASLE